MKDTDQNIILFDGQCGLCHAGISFIIRKDFQKSLHILAQHSAEGQATIKEFNLSAIAGSSIVYIRNGHCHSKSSACLLLARDVGGWMRLFAVFLIIPKPVRDIAYDIVAKNRQLFFRNQKTCKLQV